MGVSNQALVPPFLPNGGNEDGVFGLLMGAAVPTALFGHLSIGIHHDSARPPEYAGLTMKSARDSRLSDVLIGIVRQSVSEGLPGNPESRLVRIGERLMEMAAMPAGELEAGVTDMTMQIRRDGLEAAEQAADEPDCPEYWPAALGLYRGRVHGSCI